ncbi:CPBP family intramembrane glutamic endopeptidase [Spelaeicoccus albus]|uniref:CAAX prenyl protease 2/Lysostaphin resistance protein A-like domain-containing protein n=1 Tax=Spelaeicoccus albus TaxID=1280376 RepID=A0A7Z0D153_9MICO|nr:CPBP family intramembrane glutamic endopeptidase [Spelaeicoccus albus]NYI65697.1 hypothetical protein [Spelaeicoccus albus]
MTQGTRRPAGGRLGPEVLLVLGVSLGQSAVYSVVSIVDKLSRGPLKNQSATLNAPQSARQYIDLTYQLLDIGFALVPVALALYFLALRPDRTSEPLPMTAVMRRLGIDAGRPWRDSGWGIVIAACIGIPSIALYLAGHALGITATLVPTALNDYWWRVPVLILAAVKNGVLEEVVMIGYLMNRLPKLGWSMPVVIGVSAVIRGSYHLYQGFGPFAGNIVMGVVFALIFLRYRRVLPLIIAHSVIDLVGFLAPGILTIWPKIW